VSTPTPDLAPTSTATTPLGGRSVLVTGAASGLGAAVADRVAAAGGLPLVLDRRPCEVPWPSAVVELDDTPATTAAVARVLDGAPPLAGVVTCAGTDTPAPFTELPADRWEQIVRVNLFGTAAVVRAALPALEAAGGRLVTVASTLGHGVAGDASAYCASKWGVVGFTRALTEELKGRVSITLLTPGGMATGFFDDREDQYKPGADAQLCDPADVADTVVFALLQPPGCDIKEMVVAGPTEVSWP
jgi:NAD(P)-dependent dehydrogenase (short-subunit alcohol dehydrogenase family)